MERSLEQPMAALERGNRVRLYRSALKKDLKSGDANIQDILTDPPEMLDTMMIFTLLMSVPKLGPSTINKMLVRCQISASTFVGELTESQRHNLRLLLRRHLGDRFLATGAS